MQKELNHIKLNIKRLVVLNVNFLENENDKISQQDERMTKDWLTGIQWRVDEVKKKRAERRSRDVTEGFAGKTLQRIAQSQSSWKELQKAFKQKCFYFCMFFVEFSIKKRYKYNFFY